MSEETKEEAAAPLALRPDRPAVEFDPHDPVAIYMNSSIFEQLQRVAKLMSTAGFVPQHLRDKQADCFLVAAQALRWGMDPFAVAQGTYVVSGKLGYEGKLIGAVVNPRLSKKLDYRYEGAKSSKERRVFVSGTRKGESKPREIDGSVAEWGTANEKWKTMTDQMLAYRGNREWARRHMPEAVVGVQVDDEAVVDAIGVRELPPEPAPDSRPVLDRAADAISPETPPSEDRELSADLDRAAATEGAQPAEETDAFKTGRARARQQRESRSGQKEMG